MAWYLLPWYVIAFSFVFLQMFPRWLTETNPQHAPCGTETVSSPIQRRLLSALFNRNCSLLKAPSVILYEKPFENGDKFFKIRVISLGDVINLGCKLCM